jgi:transposase-like protein
LQQLTKRVLESALEGEITDHVGYEEHDPTGRTGRSTVSLPVVDGPSTEPQQPDQPLN